MSATYPQYPNTKFPDQVDTIDNFVDVTLSALPYAKQYATLYEAGNISGANQILVDHPELKYSCINAATLNPIVDAIKAMQLFYTSDIQNYLMNIVEFKGDYSGTTKYTKYDTVQYLHNSALEVFMCSTNSTPIGTLPTNTSYWIPLTMRGEKGEAGIGLTAYGSWNNLSTYPINAMVAHNNILWGSLLANTGIEPSNTATTTWYKLIEFNSDYLVFIDPASDQAYQLIVNDGLIYMTDGTHQIDIALKEDIENESTYQLAGGTATAINLLNINFVNGRAYTFIASANNNRADTTINSKPFYKPSTTIAPNIIQGRAVTFWYDSTGDCCFINASASGNADASDVLADKTVSTDEDIDIVGTLTLTGDATANDVLANKTFYNTNAKIKETGGISLKTATTYTPTTTDQIIASGQYLSGNQTIKGDPNLLAENILYTKSIFGINGTAIAGKRYASGSVSDVSSIVVTGLTFTPRVIAWSNPDYYSGVYLPDGGVCYLCFGATYTTNNSGYAGKDNCVITSNGFNAYVNMTSSYQWWAFE